MKLASITRLPDRPNDSMRTTEAQDRVIDTSDTVRKRKRLLIAAGSVVVAGLFVLAGATPAALGMLADLSEAFPTDRGAIMGLYSVFLALGQIIGSLVGGAAADWKGIDGILIATALALVVALIPLGRLRSVEHLVGGPVEGRIALG